MPVKVSVVSIRFFCLCVAVGATAVYAQDFRSPKAARGASLQAGAVVLPSDIQARQPRIEPIPRAVRRGYDPDIALLKSQLPLPGFVLKATQDPNTAMEKSQPSAPTLTTNFEGIPYTGSFPPDTVIAAGPNHIIEAVNQAFRVSTKTGSQLSATISFADWWSSAVTGVDIFDPKVAYDQHSNRWVLLAIGLNETTQESWYLISTSSSSDPMQSWCVWTLDADLDGPNQTSNWADFPQLGLDDQAFYISSNQYSFSGDIFQYAKLRVMGKTQFYNCGSVSWWDFTEWRHADNSLAFTLQPTHTFESPGKEYLLSSRHAFGSNVSVWSITNPTAVPTAIREAAVSVNSYSLPPSATQPVTGTPIDTGDARLLNAIYRAGSIYTIHTVACDTTDSCIRYLKIDVPSFAVSLDATFGASGFFYYYPAVMPDASGNILTVFNRSSSSEFAGVRYTSWRAADSSFQPSASLKAGEASYVRLDSDGLNRWGDYSGIALDPIDNSQVWIAGEFADTPANNWGTWIGRISEPSVGLGPPNDSFANATTVTSVPFTDTVNTTNATIELTDPVPGCGNGSREKGVWYRFTPGTSGTVTVDTFGSSYDTILTAWSGGPGAFTSHGCNDDSSGTLQSQFSFSAMGATTYYFMVSAYAGDGGTSVFHLSFSPTTQVFTLSVSRAGTGTGTVTSSSPGISCGTDCTENYSSGTTVTLTATPATGSVFAGWSGCDSTFLATCTLTMNANRSVTVTFNVQPPSPIPTANFLTLIPHSAAGAGYITRLFITNMTANSNAFTMNRITQSGILVSSTSTTLQPAGSMEIADSTLQRTQALTVNWFAIGSQFPIAASVLFDFEGGSVGLNPNIRQAVGALSSPEFSAFTAPVRFDSSVGGTIGLALANRNNTATTVTMKLIDQNGNVLATDSLTLNAFSQTAFVLSERPAFSSLVSGAFLGSLAVTTADVSKPVSALVVGGLFTELFSLPVVSGTAR